MTNPTYIEALEAVAEAAYSLIENAEMSDFGDYQIATGFRDDLAAALASLHALTPEKHSAPETDLADRVARLEAERDESDSTTTIALVGLLERIEALEARSNATRRIGR